MTIATTQTDMGTALSNLKGAISAVILFAATNGIDISAFLASTYTSIETEVANVNTITAAVEAQLVALEEQVANG